MRLRRFKAAANLTLAAVFALSTPLMQKAVVAQQPSQDVAVLSIAPLDRVLQDTSYLLRASGVPEMGGFVSIMANQYTQGVDRTKPMGATVTMDGPVPNAVIFMPMTDRELFFGALAGMGIEPDDLGDGLFEIDTGGQIIYAKDTGDWMFIGQTEDSLNETPADPSAMLGKLPENYDFALRINAKNVPEEIKQQAIVQIREGFERTMAEQAGQTDEERAASEAVGQASIQQIEQLVTETEQLILGWNVKKDEQVTYFDGGVQFLAGSKLAEQADMAQNVTSKYAEFLLPSSSATFRFTSMIAESDKAVAKSNFRNSISQAKGQLDAQDLPPEARELVSDLIDGLAKVMEDTIDEGVFDGAGSVSVADDTLRVLIGGRVADGAALAAEFKKAAAKLPSDPNVPKFEFDYETYKGVTLHRVTSDAKIADPAAKRILGEKLTITIGTSDKGYLIALDPTGDALAKQAIDKLVSATATKVTPFDAVISFEDILRYAQAIAPNPILDNAVTTMAGFSGKDQVKISSRLIPRGGVYRLSIDEGVMQTIGAAAKSGAGGGGGF